MKRKWLFALMAALLVLCFAVPAMAAEQWYVQLVWNDNNDAAGERPTEVVVTAVFRDSSNENDLRRSSAKFNANTSWDERKINYAQNYELDHIEISHDKEAYYTYTEDTDLSRAETTVTLTLVTSISGSIIWDDADNQDGKRPDSVTVRLHENGNEINHTAVTQNTTGNWTYSFENLPKYAGGEEIRYVVTEDMVEGYTTGVEAYTITNSYTPEKTSVSFNVAWDDNDNQDGIRPNEVTVKLYANGNKVAGKTHELNEGNNWSGSFNGLPKFKNGIEISYTVAEVTIDDYTSVMSGDATTGYTITNSHTPSTINVAGTITWDDDNDRDGKRPTSVIVRVFHGNTELDHQTVTPDDEGYWFYNFENLLKNENGNPISYTVVMDAVDGYATEISGSTITNTHMPMTTSFSGWINWNDDNNRDGIRPQRVTVKLYADGVYKA